MFVLFIAAIALAHADGDAISKFSFSGRPTILTRQGDPIVLSKVDQKTCAVIQAKVPDVVRATVGDDVYAKSTLKSGYEFGQHCTGGGPWVPRICIPYTTCKFEFKSSVQLADKGEYLPMATTGDAEELRKECLEKATELLATPAVVLVDASMGWVGPKFKCYVDVLKMK